MKIKCPHCKKKIELVSEEDWRLQIIHTLYGGQSVPDLEKWLVEKLVKEER